MTDAGVRQPSPFVIPLLYVLVVHLATNGNLGFHTDELYYIDSGRHPALGYVDFPPIVPLLARLETDLLGATPWGLRLLPTLLGGFMVAAWFWDGQSPQRPCRPDGKAGDRRPRFCLWPGC